jgi:hypothetical protein
MQQWFSQATQVEQNSGGQRLTSWESAGKRTAFVLNG